MSVNVDSLAISQLWSYLWEQPLRPLRAAEAEAGLKTTFRVQSNRKRESILRLGRTELYVGVVIRSAVCVLLRNSLSFRSSAVLSLMKRPH